MLSFYNNNEKIPLQHIVSNYCITRKSDGNNVLSFNLSKDSDEYKLIKNETVIEDDENRYLVKKINGDKFDCPLDLDFLYSSVYVNFNSGSKLLSQQLAEHLPQGWTVLSGNVRSIQRTIKFDYCTDYDIIQECMKVYDVRLVWNTLNSTVTVVAPDLINPSGEYLTDELNLRKVSYKAETTKFVTRLYAYGKDGLSFADINGGKPYVENNSYSSKVVCGYWSDKRYTVKQSLLEDAQKKVNELALPVETYECDVVDIAKQKPDEYSFLDFKLHKVVTLIDRDRGLKVNHHIVQYKEYPDEPDRNVITLSVVAETIKTSMQKIESELTYKIGETELTLEDAIKDATDRITNCLEGHVYIRHNEILIMDTEDPSTAQGLWRWTYGGLGYSANGYNGPYALALTNDGQIVADRITAGELNGVIIKAGTVTANALSVSYKQSVADDISSMHTTTVQEFTAADATLRSKIASATSKYDESTSPGTITLRGYDLPTAAGYKASEHSGEYYLNLSTGYVYLSNGSSWSKKKKLNLITSNLSSLITQTDTQIRTDVSATYSTKTEATNKADAAKVEAITAAANDATTKANTAQANAISAASTDATNKANAARNGANADTDQKLLSYSTTTQMNTAIDQTAEKISLEANARLEATVGHSSKNLLPITLESGTYTQGGANLTYTVDKVAGTITLNGTTRTSGTGYLNIYDDVDGKIAGQLYLSGGYDENARLLCYDITTGAYPKQWDGVTSSVASKGENDSAEELLIAGHNNQVRLRFYPGCTFNNAVLKPMLRDGSISDDTFEPFKSPVQTQLTETNARITETANSITLEVNKKVNTSTLEANYATKTYAENKASTAQSNAISTASSDATTKANAARDAANTDTDTKLQNYSTTEQMNSSINLTANSIKQSVSGVMSKYDTSEVSYTIALFGIGTPSQAGYKASEHNGEYYLNQSNGKVYLSNGSSWGSAIKTLKLITTNLQTQITANANAISLKVSSDTFDSSIADVYDDISYTRQQLNSEIDVLPNEITLGVSQLVYGKRTKNLIPFVLEEKTYRGITCTREDDGSGYKLTGVATDNTWFSLYTTDASVSFTNSKLADKKTIANGNYIVSGTGFSDDIQYRVEKGIDSSTYASLCRFTGETDGKPLTVTTDDSKPYIRHYIYIKSGTNMGTNGVIIRPMIRDASIADTTYTPGIDSGKYMCSAISMTPEQIKLTAGRLLITAGNFQLDGDGIVTMTGGVIKTSNYTAATSIAKTVGGKLNLSAEGSTLLFDTANFKVTGGGAVSAEDATFTNCSIVGGTFVVNSTTTEGEKTSFLSIKNAYDVPTSGGNVHKEYTVKVEPYCITIERKEGTNKYNAMFMSSSLKFTCGSNYETNINYAGLMTKSGVEAKEYTIYGVTGVAMKVGSYSTYGSTLMLGMSELPMRLCGSETVVTNGDMNFIKYDSTDNISYGISLAGSVAFRLYNNEVSVGISSKKLRFYGTNVLLSDGTAVTSDERKKNSIELLDERYLNLIRMIEPKRFKYNDNPMDRYHAGFIAQDLQSALDKSGLSYNEVAALVDVNDNGSEYAIRYGELIAMTLMYVKYLERKVNKLETQIVERSA